MSRSKNTIRFSDFSTTPIKLKYTSSYISASLNSGGITIYSGINGGINITGSTEKTTVNYTTTRHLYYSNSLTGSNLTTTSSYENYLQSSASSGSLWGGNWDNRYFPTESNSQIKVISIPRQVYGERISRHGFIMSSSAYYIRDDGDGNVSDYKKVAAYNDLEYASPEGPLEYWYTYENDAIHIGNIIYSHGMVIITNPDYIDILEPTTTTTTTTSTTSTTTTPALTTSTTTTTTTVPTTSTTTTTTTVPTTTSTTTSTTTVPTTTSTTTSTTTVPTTTTSTTTSTTTIAPTTTTSTTTSTTTAAVTSVGTTDLVGATSCTPIGTTPEIFLDSTDYAIFLSNGNCFSDGINQVSVIRNSLGAPISGTFYFAWYGGSCSYTTFKSTAGNLTLNPTQC